MRLRAITNCMNGGVRVPVGEEFDMPADEAFSLIQIGAAEEVKTKHAVPVEPAQKLEEEAIAPPPEEPKHRRSKTQSV